MPVHLSQDIGSYFNAKTDEERKGEEEAANDPINKMWNRGPFAKKGRVNKQASRSNPKQARRGVRGRTVEVSWSWGGRIEKNKKENSSDLVLVIPVTLLLHLGTTSRLSLDYLVHTKNGQHGIGGQLDCLFTYR